MTVLQPIGRRAARLPRISTLALAASALLLLSSCGGGTEQVVVFKPNRLVVIGDEASLLVGANGNGRKYSVNAFNTTSGAADCTLLPTLPQQVATHYGIVFPQCNPNAVSSTGEMRAKANALLEDSATGLAAQVGAGTPLGTGDLVTVWFGSNDVIDIYRQYARGQLTLDAATAEARRRGGVAARLVNDLLATNVRALVFTVPDLGLSPYARARVTSADPADPTGAADADAVKHLTALSEAFNAYLRTQIDSTRYNGRHFGLVFPDEVVQQVNAFPSSFGQYLTSPYNISEAACMVDLLACLDSKDSSGANNGGLVAGATNSDHLWASDRWLGYPGHYLLSVRAINLLITLPF